MNDLAAMHLVHNINQMHCENADKPVFQLLALTLARVHQILLNIKQKQSA